MSLLLLFGQDTSGQTLTLPGRDARARPPGHQAPNNLGFPPLPSHAGDRVQIMVTGIASTNQFGTPTFSFPTRWALLPSTPRPPGRVSPGGLGFPGLVRHAKDQQQLSTSGIAATDLIGVPTGSSVVILQTISPTGITSSNGFGAPTVGTNSHVAPSGIATTNLVGVPLGSSVVGSANASPSGIATSNAFGVPTLSSVTAAAIHPTGVLSADLVGVPVGSTVVHVIVEGGRFRFTPPGRKAPNGRFVNRMPAVTASRQTLTTSGIPPNGTYTSVGSSTYVNHAGQSYTLEQFPTIGRPLLRLQAVVHPSGVASSNAFGVPSVKATYRLRPSGVANTNVFGHPVLSPSSQIVIRPVGIASTNRFGQIGGLAIHPAGIVSSNRFGVPSVRGPAQWNVKEPVGRWTLGYPTFRWSSHDPVKASS